MAGEASILARMIVLELPPWESRDPGGAALAQADQLREYLSGFTAHLATWLATQADSGTLTRDIKAHFESGISHYRRLLNASGVKANNTGRVIGNWAVLRTVYSLIAGFLIEQGAPMLPEWSDLAVESAQAMREERASQLFIDTLGQLLASGDVRLVDLRFPDEAKHGTPIIGYTDEGFLYLLPEIALREVKPTQTINFTTKSIGDQLREEGWLIPGSSPNHLTVQIRIRDHRVRAWRLKRDILDREGDSTSPSL